MSSTLKIYNTLTRTKEAFTPLDPAHVRMYVCGPTVYDYAHIGNARPLIVFDVLYRLLRHLYGVDHVKYVRNITDVDDKINARAAERGITIRELTEETNRVFQDDVRALGCLAPDVQPRATEHIAQMIAIIERLIASGHAYAADGHVLFDVPSMPAYGQLSRRSLEDMRAGARVDVAPYKRGDMDFVLWKPSAAHEPGWESPWGRGRPGWHIECSAMSWEHLGETFDIHGGGIDLVFPHHENEIAQSCCAFDRKVMANYWMHNGFLQVEGEKMSKSLGNFITIHELLHRFHGNVIRLVMLQTHYTQPLDWTYRAAESARRELYLWATEIRAQFQDNPLANVVQDDVLISALCEDLNTPEAIKILRSMFKDVREGKSAEPLAKALIFLGFRDINMPGYFENGAATNSPQISMDQLDIASRITVLEANNISSSSDKRKLEEDGIILTIEDDGSVFVSLKDHNLLEQTTNEIGRLIESRLAARAAKNWAESDRIRDELAAMGVMLKDKKDGTTTWEIKR